MAMLTPDLVAGGTADAPNLLRYHLESDGAGGGTFTIPNAGGPSPDLLTDMWSGAGRRLWDILNVGGLTAVQAQELIFDNARMWSNVMPNIGLDIWDIYANVDGNGRPQITIQAATANQIAHLSIFAMHTIMS